ncbi:MAG: hypothetical protein ACON5G_17050, partial [Pirellulaceae bacterium]
MKNLNRRIFGATVVSGITASTVEAGAEAEDKERPVGPIVGHVSTTTAKVWYRPNKSGVYELQLHDTKRNKMISSETEALPENDLCVTWQVTNLETAPTYDYEILTDGVFIPTSAPQPLTTAPADNAK